MIDPLLSTRMGPGLEAGERYRPVSFSDIPRFLKVLNQSKYLPKKSGSVLHHFKSKLFICTSIGQVRREDLVQIEIDDKEDELELEDELFRQVWLTINHNKSIIIQFLFFRMITRLQKWFHLQAWDVPVQHDAQEFSKVFLSTRLPPNHSTQDEKEWWSKRRKFDMETPEWSLKCLFHQMKEKDNYNQLDKGLMTIEVRLI